MTKTTKSRKSTAPAVPAPVALPRDARDIVPTVLENMGLTKEPKNTGRGAYRLWSDDDKRHNEQVVRPFRVNVCKSAIQYLAKTYGLSNTDELERVIYYLSADTNFGVNLKYTSNAVMADIEPDKPVKQSSEEIYRTVLAECLSNKIPFATAHQIATTASGFNPK